MDGTQYGSGWLQQPCVFYLSRSYATKCCACEKDFAFMSRGYTCEFCGYFCHNSRACSRKMWLSRELFRRRICAKCDRYRKVCTRLRAGAEFTLYGKTSSEKVTLRLSESRGELLIQKETADKKVETVHLGHLEGVRRGFSHGGHMRTANYDPLRSLSITARSKKKRAESMTTYNLKATSAWLCQLWVDGLMSAKYVHRRIEDQSTATEWYESRGRSLHTAGNRLLHNYLPKNSEMKRFRKEKKRTEKNRSLCSNDSGVDSEGDCPSSLENLDLQESYIDIEVEPDSLEILSREIHPSLLFSQRDSYSPIFARPCTTSVSAPNTPALAHSHVTHSHISSSPLPISTDNLVSRSTPGLPYAESHHSAASLCSCHAYQIVTLGWSRPSSAGAKRRSRPGSAAATPQLNRSTCCSQCAGHCSVVVDLDNL